jgi:transketolase
MPINPDKKLNFKLFDGASLEKASMRLGFGDGLVMAGNADKNVVALCADLTESVGMKAFKESFADRFFEVGVAEQNLVTVASGMAAIGKVPFAGSYAVFSPGRNWEQIRTTICLNNVPVKIVGSHVGVTVGPDGASHQVLEDIALMRTLPNMIVLSPCDAIEANKMALAAAKNGNPTYIRLAREKTPVITTDQTPFEIGKAQVVFEMSNSPRHDVGIIATGHLLHSALVVAKRLEDAGKKVMVMNLSTIKPLDEGAITEMAKECDCIVTVEEHQIAGGMGSAVAECLARNYCVPMEFVGVKDQFGQSGQADELIKHYGMSEEDIYNAVQKVMMRKR